MSSTVHPLSRVRVIDAAGGRFTLWGATDGQAVKTAIHETLTRTRTCPVHVDLRDVRAVDPMFIESGLVEAATEAAVAHRALIFEVANADLVADLDQAFREHRMVASVRHGGGFRLVGDTDFVIRTLFDKLVAASPVAVDVVTQEVQGAEAFVAGALARLERSSLAVRLQPDLYVSTVGPEGMAAAFRRAFKAMKLRMFRTPLRRTPLGRPFEYWLRPRPVRTGSRKAAAKKSGDVL